MNAKKYVVAAIVLSAGVLPFAASFWPTKRQTALSGPGGKYGPVIETVLPAAKTKGATDLLDLETGRALLQPPVEYFNAGADARMTWIRSNGLDISCFVWPGGGACVTYGMTIVAVEGRCWEETTEEELLGNPALAPGQHSPRKLLVLGRDPDTYVFRTREGTLGMLRIVGLSQHGRGVNIRYKLINPAKSLYNVCSLPVHVG